MRSVGSKRVRHGAERALLAAHGDAVVAYQLQGSLAFAGMEAVIRGLVAEPAEVSHLILDFERVLDVDAPAMRMLLDLLASFGSQRRAVVLVGLVRHPRLLRTLQEARAQDPSLRLALFDDCDLAMEWCEDAVLRAHGIAARGDEELPLAKHELLQNLDAAQVEVL